MQPEQTYMQPNAYPSPPQQTQRKVIMAIVLVGVIIIVAALLVALLSGSDNRAKLGLIAAKHTEAIRLLDEYGDLAVSGNTKALVVNTRAVFRSDLAQLQQNGISASAEQQSAAVITGIDDVLQDASRNNRFDEVITEYIETVISENRLTLDEFGNAEDEKLQAALDQIKANYENLL